MRHVALFVAALILFALGCFLGYHGAVAHATTLAGLGVGTAFGAVVLAFAVDVKAACEAVFPSLLPAIKAIRSGGST